MWLALPLMMTAQGFDLVQVGAVAGVYPLVWAGGQIVFGPLSDRYGRRILILPGMLLQALGLLALATLPTFAGLLGAVVATLSFGGIAGVIAAVGVALGLTTFAVRKRV